MCYTGYKSSCTWHVLHDLYYTSNQRANLEYLQRCIIDSFSVALLLLVFIIIIIIFERIVHTNNDGIHLTFKGNWSA